MKKGTIYYFFDPLCGWCYGFSPVIKKLEENFRDQFNFEVVCGGMVMGSRVQPIAAMSDYLLQAYPRVEDYTGVKFGAPWVEILKEGTYVSNSLPPSLAINAFRSLKPDQTVRFAHDVQRAFYLEGKSLNEDSTFLELIQKFDLDEEAFLQKMKSVETEKSTHEEFAKAQRYNVSGFPTVIFENPDARYILARGFQSYENMEHNFHQIMEAIS